MSGNSGPMFEVTGPVWLDPELFAQVVLALATGDRAERWQAKEALVQAQRAQHTPKTIRLRVVEQDDA